MMQTKTPADTGASSRAWAGTRHTQSNTRTEAASRGQAVMLNGACCGYILGDTFERLFNRNINLFRRYGNALCNHTELIERLDRDGVAWFDAIDETGAHHWLQVAEILKIGVRINDPRFGPQIAVPIKFWRHSKAIATPADPEPGWSQGALL